MQIVDFRNTFVQDSKFLQNYAVLSVGIFYLFHYLPSVWNKIDQKMKSLSVKNGD